MADEFCKIGFRFKPSHEDKHYLMSLKGRKYSTTWTTDPSMAGKVSLAKKEIGMEWIRKKLAKSNFGQENGYAFCGFVEFSDGTTTTYIWSL